MAKKKRHHYIPKFYLRRFSKKNEGKLIGLFNCEKNLFVREAELRHQAYENFLYGKDGEVEDALAKMEDDVAKMFYYWTEEKLLYPPPPETNGFKLLKRFILYQAFRTPKSGDEIMKKLNEGLKVILKEFQPELWKKMKGSSLSHENPVLFGFLNSISHEHLLNFLDCKFLVNLSPLPLITSDAPVIFYNQLMEKANIYIGATALVVKGLQIFYPIHPRLMICLYDSSVYELGTDSDNCPSIESLEEIHQLNGLQLINCNSQIYFDNIISEDYIKGLNSDFKKYRGTSKNINKIINQNKRKYFFISSEDVRINLKLDLFRIKVNPNDYKNMIAPLRHNSLERLSID